MFTSLFKAAVGVVVETPIAIVADMVTFGGLATDQDTPYTAQAIEKIMDNLEESTEGWDG